MATGDWHGWEPGLRRHLDALVSGSRWRYPRTFDAHGTSGRLGTAGDEPDRREPAVVSFASNDYLGLTAHPAVKRAAIAAIGFVLGHPRWRLSLQTHKLSGLR